MDLYEEIERVFPVMEAVFSPAELLHFKNAPVGDLYLYHFGMGTWIRNNLLYSAQTPLYQLFAEHHIVHSDDMSSLIIRLFHYNLSKRP